MLSLPFLDRDATRYLYISKANTKSIWVIMQFNCICSANLSSSICKLLYYKKFKSLAESQIRPGSNIKTLPAREISKSNSRQQNIKWCVERHKMWYKFIKCWLLLFYLRSEQKHIAEGFSKLPHREPFCRFLITLAIWIFHTFIFI